MTGLLVSVLAFAVLFVGFGLLNRGKEGCAGCGCQPGKCEHGPDCSNCE
jgi:hypothetical protein